MEERNVDGINFYEYSSKRPFTYSSARDTPRFYSEAGDYV